MLVLVTAAALWIAGWGVAATLWRDRSVDMLERACAATTLGFAIWIALDWLFALTGTFTHRILIVRTAVAVAAAAWVLLRAYRQRALTGAAATAAIRACRSDRLIGAFLVILGFWVLFILWRGAIIPPVSHDALSNHLPRALLFSRAAGFVDLSAVSAAFQDIPVNYELLLADIITMTGGDEYTEWLSTLLYVLFVIASGALAQRWWMHRAVSVVVMGFVSGIPVLLLHSGAHKNDIMVSLFMLLGLLWAGRYLERGETGTLVLLVLSGALAAGTKPHGGLLVPVLVPIVIWRLVQDLRAGRDMRRQAIVVMGVVLLSTVLLGGYTWFDSFFGPAADSNAVSTVPYTPSYGDWSNLWQAPWVLAYAPFSPDAHSLYVPWEDGQWYWPRREIFFSHLGIPFALSLLAAPFVAGRRGVGRRERVAILIAAVAIVVAMLPVWSRPHGKYLISLPRYILFFAPVVIAWTAGALMTRSERFVRVLLIASMAFFVFYAVETAVNDTFAPIEYVLYAHRVPGTRHIPFDPYRATSQLDKFAGPRDPVALDVAWGSWIHPAFGPQLARPMFFIPPGEGPPQIPENVRWVVVERAFGTAWGNPNMKTLADARRLFNTNAPAAGERRVTEYLRRDPRFRLVGEDRRRNQAIFVRVQ